MCQPALCVILSVGVHVKACAPGLGVNRAAAKTRSCGRVLRCCDAVRCCVGWYEKTAVPVQVSAMRVCGFAGVFVCGRVSRCCVVFVAVVEEGLLRLLYSGCGS